MRAKTILTSGEPLVTTDHVLVETWMLLQRRIRNGARGVDLGRIAKRGGYIEPVGLADLEAAWQIGLSLDGQDFSIVARTSFAVMRRLGIERVASLDDVFAVFRFGPKHRQAFTIVR